MLAHTLLMLRLGVDSVVTLVLLGTNVFILYATVRFRRRQMAAFPHSKKAPVRLIINLSTADLMVSLFYVYLFLPRYISEFNTYLQHHLVACILRNVLITTAHFSSMFTLVAIAVDRYVAVVYSLRYGEIISTRRTFIAITAIWTVATFQATMLFYWNTWQDGRPCEVLTFQPKLYDVCVVTLNIAFVSVSMSVIYWRVGHVAAQGRDISLGLSASNKANKRISVTLLLILVIFTASWAPHVICLYLNHTGYYVPPLMFQLSSLIVKVNYVANPFIYALNTRSIRHCLIEALASFKRCN